MKLPSLSTTPSKKVLLGSSVTTVAVAFLAGAIITAHQPPTRNLDLAGKKTADTLNQSTGTATPGTGSAAATTAPSAPSGVASGATTSIGGAAASAPATSTPITGATALTIIATAPVTATSASLSDWTAPQTTGPNSTVRHQYCVWGYSDGTTKQKVYRTEYTGTNSGATIMAGFDCTVASAP